MGRKMKEGGERRGKMKEGGERKGKMKGKNQNDGSKNQKIKEYWFLGKSAYFPWKKWSLFRKRGL